VVANNEDEPIFQPKLAARKLRREGAPEFRPDLTRRPEPRLRLNPIAMAIRVPYYDVIEVTRGLYADLNYALIRRQRAELE